MVIEPISFWVFFIFLQHTDHLLNPLVIKNFLEKNLSINKCLMRQSTKMKLSVTKTKASLFVFLLIFVFLFDKSCFIIFIA